MTLRISIRVCRYACRHRAASDAVLQSCSEKGVYLRVGICIIQGRDAQNTVRERDCEIIEYLSDLERRFINTLYQQRHYAHLHMRFQTTGQAMIHRVQPQLSAFEGAEAAFDNTQTLVCAGGVF